MKHLKNFYIVVTFVFLFVAFNYPEASGQIGEMQSSFSTSGYSPTGLTWDGTSLWNIDYSSDRICRIDPETGIELQSFSSPGSQPAGLAWDGTHLWCSDNNSDKIYKVDTTGTVLNSFDVTSTPRGLEFFNGYLWYVDSVLRKIYKINPNSGAVVDSIEAPSGANRGLAFDGKYLWCTDCGVDEMYKIDIARKKVIMIIKSPAAYSYGLAWDGECVWVAGYNSRNICRISVFGTNHTAIIDSFKVSVQYKVTVKNTGSADMNLRTWICKPYESIRQRLDSPIIWNPAPISFVTDNWDQETAYYIEAIAPGVEKTYYWSANVTTYSVRYYIFPDSVGTINDIPENIRQDYTVDGSNYDIYDPVIQYAVSEAVGNETNLYWKVRNIHDYIIEHIYYNMDGRWDSAPVILTQGHGSCSEYTYLFVAMCRAAGIPAKYEAGGHVRQGELPYEDTVFHRWHLVYLPPYGWIHVDTTWDDKDYPANQARYFGGTSSEVFATTMSGGGSYVIFWSYNSFVSAGGVPYNQAKVMIWSDTTTNIIADEPDRFLTEQFILEQNYPNPFNSWTRINFMLPEDDRVTVTIYNILGQQVRQLLKNEFIPAGMHFLIWNGKNKKEIPVPSGVYIYRLSTGKGYIGSRRMIFLK